MERSGNQAGGIKADLIHNHRRRRSVAAWFGVCLAVFLTGEPAPAEEAIRQNRAILALSPAEAEKEALAIIEGIVTLYAPELQLCFVQDSTAGIYCYPAQWPAELHTGDRVRVRGKTGQGHYSPIIQLATFERIGKGDPPTPLRIAVEQLATGRHDSQWVVVEGVVQRQEVGYASLDLELAAGNSKLPVMVMNRADAKELDLVDSRVRMTGVVGSRYNSRGQLTGFHLTVPGLGQIEVLSPAPNPFELPLTSSDGLLIYAQDGEVDRRTRLKGVVALDWTGEFTCVQDKMGVVRVSRVDKTRLAPGQLVEVVGFPKIESSRPSLDHAIVRVVGQGPPPTTIPISLGMENLAAMDGQHVRVRGEIAHVASSVGLGERIVLIEGGRMIVLVFPGEQSTNPNGAQTAGLTAGSKVEARGILAVPDGKGARGAQLELWCQDNGSLSVLEFPSFWKSGRWFWVVAAMAGTTFAGVALVGFLNARVNRKTDRLRDRERLLEHRYRDLFENANDILLTHDLHGRITSINQTGEMALGVRREDLGNTRVQDLLAAGSNWPVGIIEGSGTPPPPRSVELEFKGSNGVEVSLDCRIRPIFENARAVGFQVIAHDISDRKRAEAALRESERHLRELLEARERLGRDLHDGIIQSIYAIGLKLEACAHTLTTDPSASRRLLNEVRQDMNSAIRQVRECIRGSDAGEMSPAELRGALRSLALSLGEPHSSRIRIEMDADLEKLLRPREATQLLRIAGEAMTNCVRHASASSMQVSLSREQERIRLMIEDDGRGFDPLAEGRNGFGLRNMAARAREIGARFDLFSRRGEGTRIVLDLDTSRSP